MVFLDFVVQYVVYVYFKIKLELTIYPIYRLMIAFIVDLADAIKTLGQAPGVNAYS
jgi:hypothetical protein